MASSGHLEPQTGPNRVFADKYLTAKSPKAVKQFCLGLYGSGPGYTACLVNPENETGWQTNWVSVCENLDDQTEYFARPGSSSRKAIAGEALEDPDTVYLGDAVPNPTKETATITVNWPKEKGELVIFELGTGKVVKRHPIGNGQQQTTFQIKDLSAGVYGYRLEGECPCPEPKRLIVIH